MRLTLTTILALSLLATACGDANQEEDPDAGLARTTPIATSVRNAAPDPINMDAVVQQQLEVGLRFQQTAAGGDEPNTVTSPHSLNTWLGQVYLASSGTTRTDLAENLGFPVEDDSYHEAANALHVQLAQNGNSDDVALTIVNHSWYAPDKVVKDQFLFQLGWHYGSDAYRIDFADDSELARATVNARIDRDTKGLVPEFFGPEDVTPRTKYLLVNSVYFNAKWAQPFDPSSTLPRDFTNLDGQAVRTETMHLTGYVAGAKTEAYDALRLDYKSNALSILYIVPNADFAAFEGTLDATTLSDVDDALEIQETAVRVPRLQLRTKVSLDPVMNTAFGIDLKTGTYENLGPLTTLTTAKQETIVVIDEAGSKAAGVTGGGNNGAGPIEPELEIAINRPYLFFIQDNATGAVLFQGRVTEYPIN